MVSSSLRYETFNQQLTISFDPLYSPHIKKPWRNSPATKRKENQGFATTAACSADP
jgi:hypothetical protein